MLFFFPLFPILWLWWDYVTIHGARNTGFFCLYRLSCDSLHGETFLLGKSCWSHRYFLPFSLKPKKWEEYERTFEGISQRKRELSEPECEWKGFEMGYAWDLKGALFFDQSSKKGVWIRVSSCLIMSKSNWIAIFFTHMSIALPKWVSDHASLSIHTIGKGLESEKLPLGIRLSFFFFYLFWCSFHASRDILSCSFQSLFVFRDERKRQIFDSFLVYRFLYFLAQLESSLQGLLLEAFVWKVNIIECFGVFKLVNFLSLDVLDFEAE